MSKADEMGGSSAFARAGTARSARGRAIKNALEGSAPTQLALHLISHNPDNPREQLGDVTDLANTLRDHGQSQPLDIMTREAYLTANPDREDELEPRAMYVVIEGNRRLAAAREAGLSSVKVAVDDTAKDSGQILERALVANIHRQAFEPLDEAKALQRLLEIHGTQDALAQRLHRSQGWVSQRLALLGLTPELKQRLENGEEKSVELLRRVGNKPPEQQQAALDELKRKKTAERTKTKQPWEKPLEDERAESREKGIRGEDELAEKAATSSETRTDPSPQPNSSSGEGERGENRANGSDHYGVMKSASGEPVAVVMPWHNPSAMKQILREHMRPDDLRQLSKELAELV
ncbi:ParB/RepB/Spo0J family partition protein [Streptomyces sp. ME19-01-6]|uniref:ParB/RepB/Spo0J family partition protein n=1 Tax=Streptomyces sp. ME19-01-6 TaxID=3028686 RepID=UPI0029B95387|nr:ParB/RepB/Spo0J family partition protein [Streptomyces sp. ME19-01-6]MDX3232933.1 ParB/RepB/Spo0J family partition protein [Streptomyces sp. ME19-01-6]